MCWQPTNCNFCQNLPCMRNGVQNPSGEIVNWPPTKKYVPKIVVIALTVLSDFVPNEDHNSPFHKATLLAKIDDPLTLEKEPPISKVFGPFIARAETIVPTPPLTPLFVEFDPNILHEEKSQEAILLAEIDPPSTLENEPPTNKLFVPFIARALTWPLTPLFVKFVPKKFHEFPSQDAILLAKIDPPATLVNEPPTNKLFVPFIARAQTGPLIPLFVEFPNAFHEFPSQDAT